MEKLKNTRNVPRTMLPNSVWYFGLLPPKGNPTPIALFLGGKDSSKNYPLNARLSPFNLFLILGMDF